MLARQMLFSEARFAWQPKGKDGRPGPLFVDNELDILEAPWPTRETTLLREQFNADYPSDAEKARHLIAWIRETGLEPFAQPPLLPPIEMDDIRLVCWMAIEPTA
jgi:hypothetical protein